MRQPPFKSTYQPAKHINRFAKIRLDLFMAIDRANYHWLSMTDEWRKKNADYVQAIVKMQAALACMDDLDKATKVDISEKLRR
jgi:hypothetical protein